MPHLAEQVNDIAVIRSMHTTSPAHPAALYKFQGGRMLPGLPALGAWVVYGLGTDNQNLPFFVVLDDPQGLPINGIANWQARFLATDLSRNTSPIGGRSLVKSSSGG